MPIYEMMSDTIQKLPEKTFAEAGVRERGDLQRLLRAQIEVVAPGVRVLAEEFGDWEDSKRRIDLLGLDKDANLVVIELKRDTGEHMELQAVRYAAMVAAMTFEKAVEVHGEYLRRLGGDGDAQAAILGFLGWEEPDEDHFAQDVRIVLVSAEFSKEITTAVMWLNEHGLDIRCVRLRPYDHAGRLLLDVQQVIPLPEAEDYQVRIREKAERERNTRREQSDLGKLYQGFWTGLLAKAREKTDLHARISPTTGRWITATAGKAGLSFQYVFGRQNPRLELYIDTGEKDRNKAIFDKIVAHREAIEERFGAALNWRRLGEEAQASIVEYPLPAGTVRDEAGWPKLQDEMVAAMVRFEAALRPAIDELYVR